MNYIFITDIVIVLKYSKNALVFKKLPGLSKIFKTRFAYYTTSSRCISLYRVTEFSIRKSFSLKKKKRKELQSDKMVKYYYIRL